MSSFPWLAIGTLALVAAPTLMPRPVRADPRSVAPEVAGDAKAEVGLALIVGVNKGVDADSIFLRYADDDAVRFRALFRTVGMKTFTLARIDDNTARLHPGVDKEVAVPTLRELRKAVAEVRAIVAAAKAAGKRTALYFVYAGHGKASDTTGYIMLEDARLSGSDLLSEIIDPVAASSTHVMVDACHSYFAVLGRGPGGRRRPLRGFSDLAMDLGEIARRSDIGVLLSTSSARESHEWAAFQAGVFSHEVRSGLYGAADVDGDGLVSYREIASFVDRANSAVPNEKFRPEVFARAPVGAATLLDLRGGLASRIEVDDPHRGHQYLEDSAGVRWADFHNGGKLRLLRPTASRLYLRRTSDDRELTLPEVSVSRVSGAPGTEVSVVYTAALSSQDSPVVARGAANDLFRSLFALPFTPASLDEYAARERSRQSEPMVADGPRPSWRRWTALAAGLGGVVAAAAGTSVLSQAHAVRDNLDPALPQTEAADVNQRITAGNRWGLGLLGGGGAALVAGVTLWLLDRGATPSSVPSSVPPNAPPDAPSVDVVFGSVGLSAGLRGSF